MQHIIDDEDDDLTDALLVVHEIDISEYLLYHTIVTVDTL